MADDSLTAADLAADSVAASELANNSVVGGAGGDVSDDSLTAADLAADSVTGSELANGAVVGGAGGDVSDGTLTTDDIAADTITAADLAADSVAASELADNAVDNAAMADDAVRAAEVQNGSLRAADIGVLSGSVAIDPPSVATSNCATAQSAANSVPGIQVGDHVIVTPPDTLSIRLVGTSVRQTAADRLTVRLCNIWSGIGSGAVDDTSRTWQYIVTR